MPPFSAPTAARMDDLLAVIAELGLELHPDRISVVASKIETLGSVEQFAMAEGQEASQRSPKGFRGRCRGRSWVGSVLA